MGYNNCIATLTKILWKQEQQEVRQHWFIEYYWIAAYIQVQYRVTGVHPTGLTVARGVGRCPQYGIKPEHRQVHGHWHVQWHECGQRCTVDMGMGKNLTLGVDMDMAMKKFKTNADRIPLWQYACDMLVGV